MLVAHMAESCTIAAAFTVIGTLCCYLAASAVRCLHLQGNSKAILSSTYSYSRDYFSLQARSRPTTAGPIKVQVESCHHSMSLSSLSHLAGSIWRPNNGCQACLSCHPSLFMALLNTSDSCPIFSKD